MNKRKKVAWHKHLAKAKKADEKRRAAKAAPVTTGGARAAAAASAATPAKVLNRTVQPDSPARVGFKPHAAWNDALRQLVIEVQPKPPGVPRPQPPVLEDK
jgi:hypothetical protein